MQEGLAEPGLVVAELGFGDGEVLPDTVAFGAVGIGQAFHGVQDGTRPLVFPRQRGLAGDRAFQRDVGRELRMKNDAEAQAPIGAEAERGSSRGRSWARHPVCRQGCRKRPRVAGVRLPMVIGSSAWAFAVASSAVSLDNRSDRLAMVPGRSRTLRRATYCSSRWFFLSKVSRCNSASASARVSTAGLPDAIALTSA